jgi:hypothetical protein
MAGSLLWLSHGYLSDLSTNLASAAAKAHPEAWRLRLWH